LKTNGEIVAVKAATRIIAALVASLMTPSRRPIVEAAIIRESRAEGRNPPATVSRHEKDTRKARAETLFIAKEATSRTGKSSREERFCRKAFKSN